MFYRTLTHRRAAARITREAHREDCDELQLRHRSNRRCPSQNYHATFKVFQSGDATIIDWSGWFDAKGATDAEAAAVMAGIFEAGLNSIVADRALANQSRAL